MTAEKNALARARRTPPAHLIGDAPARSISAVEERLASVEGELRVQFTRIAQLQAQLDVMLAVFRRLPQGDHTSDAMS